MIAKTEDVVANRKRIWSCSTIKKDDLEFSEQISLRELRQFTLNECVKGSPVKVNSDEKNNISWIIKYLFSGQAAPAEDGTATRHIIIEETTKKKEHDHET